MGIFSVVGGDRLPLGTSEMAAYPRIPLFFFLFFAWHGIPGCSLVSVGLESVFPKVSLYPSGGQPHREQKARPLER